MAAREGKPGSPRVCGHLPELSTVVPNPRGDRRPMSASTARRGALALLLAALVLFLLGSIELARAATQTVTMGNFAFSPATVTVTAGDTITWTNDDAIVHTATSATGAFDSGDLAPGDSYSVTFTTAGTY